jgi:hypothetical protein
LEPKSNYDFRKLGAHLGKILFMTLARALTQSAAMVALAVAAVGMVTSSGTAWAQTWILLGREGGCVTLAEAARRKPEFKGVAGPEDLARRLRANGHAVTLREMGTAEVRVVAVEAPDAGIGVIFAPEHMCRN